MDNFDKLYLDALNEERENRMRVEQDNKCFLTLVGHTLAKLKAFKNL